MKHLIAVVVAILLMVASVGLVSAGSTGEWVVLSSDSENDLRQKIKGEVEKRDTFSTPQEESSNLKMVEEEKTKEDSEYKISITNLTTEFSKYKKERDAITTQFQAASTEFEEMQKELKNIKTAIENYDKQIARYEQDIKAQKESFTKWLKTEKQGEAVVAVIYTRGLKDAAHELDKQADILSAPLMAAQMGTYVKSHTTVINNTLVKDVIQGTEEGTAKWNGEEPLRIELDKGSKGTVYLRIKRYELYPFQSPESGKINGNGASDKMAAGLIQSPQDLETFLSKNGYSPKNLDFSKVGNQIKEASQCNRQADTDLNAQSRAFEEKVVRLNDKISNAKSDKELQLNSLKRKDAPYKKMEAELDAFRKQKDEAEKLLNDAQSRLSDKKHIRETIIVKAALVTPKGAQTPAEAVAEMVMDKLSEVKNDARVQHTTSTVTVVNSQFAGETGTQAVTEAKINRVRLISFINEGESVKVKMAFRVKTVLSDTTPSGGSEVQKNQLEKETSKLAIAKGLRDNGNGTVTDNATKLMWQQANGGIILWRHAITYCKSLSLAGYDDWRLPNKKELKSIIVSGKDSPVIYKAYFSTAPGTYWSSSTAGGAGAVWSVNLDDGYAGTGSTELRSSYARCVREDNGAPASISAKTPVKGSPNSEKIEMVFVKGGCFQMGDTFGDGDANEKPVHNVCVDDFYMGKYEVTQKQWVAGMGSNPSNFKNCDDCPVEQVSWNDIQEYIGRLNNKTGKNYRLPTEAEWEYAARSGGKREKYSGGDDVDSVAWYSNNSDGKTIPGGRKAPNGLKIFDMSGNIMEWVSDWYDENYYGSSPKNNPIGPSSGKSRVCRGGSFDTNFAAPIRTTYRFGYAPTLRPDFVGFRVAASAR